jgi:hypothetical protein
MELSFSSRAGGEDRPSLLSSNERGSVMGGMSRRTLSRSGEENSGRNLPHSLAAAAEELRRRRRETIERINTKIHAFFWVLAAALTVYYTRIWEVVWSDPRILGCVPPGLHTYHTPSQSSITLLLVLCSIFVDVGLISIGIVLTIMLYLTVYLPRIARITVDWDVYDPRMIPAATAAGVASIVWYVHELSASGIPSSARKPVYCCSFLIGLWPVYGLLTPAILAILFMGSIMSLHFIPYC